ncbi:hypothetical protein Avbf_17531, partial [Armadillidium vulgare]
YDHVQIGQHPHPFIISKRTEWAAKRTTPISYSKIHILVMFIKSKGHLLENGVGKSTTPLILLTLRIQILVMVTCHTSFFRRQRAKNSLFKIYKKLILSSSSSKFTSPKVLNVLSRQQIGQQILLTLRIHILVMIIS